MSTVIRTLVGLKLGSTLIPIQSKGDEQNNEWLKLYATSSIRYDLVALTKRMPVLTFETNAVKTLLTALSNDIYKVDDIEFYEGSFSETPSNGYYFSTTGVLKGSAEDAVVFIDEISGDINEPLSSSFKVRGASITYDDEYELQNFTITHGSVHTIKSLSFNSNTIGLRSFRLSTNIDFYDYYENSIDPTMSAIKGVDIQATATILIDHYSLISEITTPTDFVINLNKYQAGGLPQVSGGTITLKNCVVTADSKRSAIGDVSTVDIVMYPESITFGLS